MRHCIVRANETVYNVHTVQYVWREKNELI